jgi:heat shock protein HtpX
VKDPNLSEHSDLQETLNKLSKKSGIKSPKLGISSMLIPNAFAYGSPLYGNSIAVTKGLLNELNMDEVEAVLGHEVGHLKHRDVQLMMFVSFLPSIIYLLGRWMFYPSLFSGSRNYQRRNGNISAVIGSLSLVVYFVLSLFTLNLSRLREYYADLHSVSVVEGGSFKLSSGLVKIVSNNSGSQKPRVRAGTLFKSLFIADPEESQTIDSPRLIDDYLHRNITRREKMLEIFSTHPNLTKRLRALNNINPQL